MPPRFFCLSGGLPDTYVLGNLPKIGTGFVEIHGSLREIPEGDEKYGRLSAPYFLPFENDEVGLALSPNNAIPNHFVILER